MLTDEVCGLRGALDEPLHGGGDGGHGARELLALAALHRARHARHALAWNNYIT